jgi:hypothetical protein
MLMIFMALGIDKFSELKQRQNTSRERFFLHACLLTLFLYAVLGTILGRLTLNEMVLVLLFVFIAYFIRVPQRFDKGSFLLVTTVSSVVAVLFSFMSAPWIATQSYSTSVYKTTKMEGISNLYKIVRKLDPERDFRVLMRGDFQQGFAAMLGGYSGVRTLQYYINPAPLKQAVDADFNGVIFGDFKNIEYRYFGLLGTRFVICDDCKAISDKGFKFIESVSEYKLYENVNARPYIYSGKFFTKYTDREDLLTKIAASQNLEENWIIDSPQANLPRSFSSCEYGLLIRSAPKVVVEYSCENSGVLVLNEFFDSKWKATVNGVEWPIIEINGNQNGVVLGADHPGMDGGDELAGRRLEIVGREPAGVFGQDRGIPVRQQMLGGEAGAGAFVHAGDGGFADPAGGHGAVPPAWICGT